MRASLLGFALFLVGCSVETYEPPPRLNINPPQTDDVEQPVTPARRLVACPTVDCSFYIDPAFTDDERAAILRAASKWMTVAKAPITPEWRVIKERPSRPDAMGWSDGAMRTVWITPDLPTDYFYAVVLHELGHAHGVWDHVKHGVMQAELVTPLIVEFTDEDIAECRREGVC